MKRLLPLLLAFSAVPAFAQCPAVDAFSGSGALNSSNWNQTSVGGTSLLIQSSSTAVPTSSSTKGQAVWIGSACTPGADQYSQLVAGIESGITGPMVRATVAGNGYLWSLGSGSLYALAGFGGTLISNCPAYTTGHTYQLVAKGTTIKGFDNGTQVCSAVDTTYSSGNPGILVDHGVSNSDSVSSFQTGIPPLDAPTFSPAPGTFTLTQTVSVIPQAGSIACATINGSTPTATAGTCTNGGPGPFTVSTTTTIKAISTQTGQTNSAVSSGLYTIRPVQSYFIRPGGGTRQQCTGIVDADYSGSGTGQPCGFKDFRSMWTPDDGTGGAGTWIGASGDTVVIRGCTALPGQANPSNPSCRIGEDEGVDGNPPNSVCPGVPNTFCYNPTIPAGTPGAHTRIIGACVLAGNCTPIDHQHYPYTSNNLAKLFGGFGLTWTFNLKGTQYVDIIGIELTTHNGVCTVAGSPAFPRGCSTNSPVDDYAQNGFLTDNTSANILFQDVYIHGFNSSGIWGPIGGPITATRVFTGFNATSGWNFDDGFDTPDGAGSQILATNVTAMGNGCYEEYPIVHTGFPAQACYDSVSNGFGDGWSGQDGVLDVLHCDHCDLLYNTKDGFIGPHVQIADLVIKNSYGYGNMGTTWKWGATPNSTVLFQNNLTVGNCARMQEAPPGAAHNFAGTFITNIVVTGGNLATFTTSPQAFTAGQQVFFWSFNNSGVWVNGQTLTVLSSGLTSTQFQATVSQASGTYTDTGATSVKNSGSYLTNYCRAGGAQFATITRVGSVNNYFGNTIVGAAPIIFQQNCGFYTPPNHFNQETNCSAVPQTYKDNNFLGFNDPAIGNFPALYFPETSSIIFTGSWNNEFGIKSGTGDTCGTNNITCANPLQTSMPTSPWPGSETALDVFNPYAGSGNSFFPSSISPLLNAGTPITGLTTDYYAATRPSPPSLGGAERSGAPTLVSIAVTPNPGAVTVSSTLAMTCTSTFSDSSTAACSSPVWTDTGTHSSINSSTGVVTGASVGADTVTATIGSISGNATVNVSAPSTIGVKLSGTLTASGGTKFQ